jgi:glycine cleavage system regulatory protein
VKFDLFKFWKGLSMPLMIAPEGREHVFWAPLANMEGAELKRTAPAVDQPRKHNVVEVVSPDCAGLVAVACQAFYRNSFNVEWASVSRMLAFFQGSYLISSQPGDVDTVERTSRQILDRTVQLARSPAFDYDPGEAARFVVSVGAPRDAGGIMAGVASLLAEHRANIVWATAAATPVKTPGRPIDPRGPKKFSAQIEIEIHKRQSALQLIRIKTGLDMVGKHLHFSTGIAPAATRFPVENDLMTRLGESDHDQLRYEGDDQ